MGHRVILCVPACAGVMRGVKLARRAERRALSRMPVRNLCLRAFPRMHANAEETTTMPFISNWRLCNKCQVLCYAGGPDGVCQAGGAHDFAGSKNYALVQSDPTAPGEPNWKRCDGCQQLFYAGSTDIGDCPKGGKHNHTGNFDYIVGQGEPGWKWCQNCQAMCYDGDSVPGPCPGLGGNHAFEAAPHHSHPRPPVYVIAFTGD